MKTSFSSKKNQSKEKKGKTFPALKKEESLLFYLLCLYLEIRHQFQTKRARDLAKEIKKNTLILKSKESSIEEKKEALIKLALSRKKEALIFLKNYQKRSQGFLKLFSNLALRECATAFRVKLLPLNLEEFFKEKNLSELLKEIFPYEFCNRKCRKCIYWKSCFHYHEELFYKLVNLRKIKNPSLIFSLEEKIEEIQRHYSNLGTLIYRSHREIKVKDISLEDMRKIKKVWNFMKKDPLFKEFNEIEALTKSLFLSLIEKDSLLKERKISLALIKKISYDWIFFAFKKERIFFDYYFGKLFLKKNEKPLSHLIAAANFFKNFSYYLFFQQRIEKKLEPFYKIEFSILRTKIRDYLLKLEKKFPELYQYLDKVFIL